MAPVKHARGTRLVLKVGDGASPEIFTAKCSINAARSLSGEAQTNDFNIPDCADPDALAWVVREKIAVSYSFTGAGILDTQEVGEFASWLASRGIKNCQVVVDVPASDGGVIFEGAWHLTTFEITGERGGKVEVSIGAVSDGEIEVTANT